MVTRKRTKAQKQQTLRQHRCIRKTAIHRKSFKSLNRRQMGLCIWENTLDDQCDVIVNENRKIRENSSSAKLIGCAFNKI